MPLTTGDLFHFLRRWTADNFPGSVPVEVSITLSNMPTPVQLPVPLLAPGEQAAQPPLLALDVERPADKPRKESERNILEALGRFRLNGKELARQAGYKLNSYTRTVLRDMRVRGLIDKDLDGNYFAK